MTYDWEESARRARLLVPLLYVDAAVLVATVVMVLPSADGLTPSRSGFMTTFLVMAVLWVTTVLLWLRWFYVVAKRAEATGRTRFRGSWWFWAWVIPGANLVLPMMMINDAWHAADARRPEYTPTVMDWWWRVWVVTGVLNYVTDRFDVPDTAGAPALFLAILLAEAVQIVLGAGMVRHLTARDRLLGNDPAWIERAYAGQPVP